MNELREIQKAVVKYENLLANNQENAKMYCKEYMEDLEILKTVNETYIDSTVKIFQEWCNFSVIIFETVPNNIFQRIKKCIDMKIANHYLNTISYKMSKAGILQIKLDKINLRFIQYQYFN